MPLGRAAAEDHHARRRGDRARHRVQLVPQRPAARVGARARDAHRRRRGRRRDADGEHADLFRAFPNSYGTLGYALRLVIELEPVRPYVALRHVRFPTSAELTDRDRRDRRRRGRGTASRWTSSTARCSPPTRPTSPSAPGRTRRRTPQRLHRTADLLPVDPAAARRLPDRRATTCGGGTPTGSGARGRSARRTRRIRRLWPKRWLRSDVYWKIVALENRLPRRGPARAAARAAAAGAGRAGRRDPARPHGRLPRLVPARGADRAGLAVPDPAARRPGRPARPRPARRPGRSTRCGRASLRQRRLLVDRADRAGPRPTATSTGAIEAVVAEHGGHKSLYSDAYYDEDEFRALYGGAEYRGGQAALRPRRHGCWTSTRRR